MTRPRLTLRSIAAVVLGVGCVLAALRSGSNDAFALTYSATFAALVYAAVAAKFRGPAWHGVAVAGWAYFLVGFGPWVAASDDLQRPGAINRDLIAAVIPEMLVPALPGATTTMPLYVGMTPTARATRGGVLDTLKAANRAGVTHCGLTFVAAGIGGLVAAGMDRRAEDDRVRAGWIGTASGAAHSWRGGCWGCRDLEGVRGVSSAGMTGGLQAIVGGFGRGDWAAVHRSTRAISHPGGAVSTCSIETGARRAHRAMAGSLLGPRVGGRDPYGAISLSIVIGRDRTRLPVA